MHFLLYLGDLVTLTQEQQIGSVSGKIPDNSGKLALLMYVFNICCINI